MSKHLQLESTFHLVHALKRQINHQIKELGYDIAPMHMRVMKIITKIAPCTSIDIAHVLKRDKSQITRLLNTLIDNDLLAKVSNPSDKRSHFLELTQSGLQAMEDLSIIDNQVFKKMTQGIEHSSLDIFKELTEKMIQNLE